MTTASTPRPKRARASRGATTHPSTTSAGATAAPSSQASRRELIAANAYLRAERRGFQGGDPIADWLESEKEVDTLLSSQGG